MPWGSKNVRCQRSGLYRIRLADVLVDIDFAGASYADPRGLDVEHLEQFVIVLVEQDGSAGRRPQLHGSANMVDMRVGNDNLLYLQVVFAHYCENVLYFSAGIDDHGFVRGLVANHRAVALQRANGKDFVNHCGSLSALSGQLSG